MKNNTYGFTLLELIIGMFVAGLLMVAIVNVFSGTAKNSVFINDNSSLTKESQIAQQVISGHLGEAIYIWPSGVTTNLLLSSAGVTTANTLGASPTTNGQKWMYGDTSGGSGTVAYYTNPSATPKVPYAQNFVAMILPPIAPMYTSGIINNCTGTGSGASDQTDGCYRFYAYFPMRRSYLTSLSTGQLAETSRPKADPRNDFPGDIIRDRWVLMEYRANLFDSSTANTWMPNNATSPTSGFTILPSATLFQGRSANVLVDYVKPHSVSFTVYRPVGNDPVTNEPVKGSALPNGRVDYTFSMEQFNGRGPTLPITGSAGTLGGSVLVKNWYCPKDVDLVANKANCP